MRYNISGNIVSKTEYAYTTGTVGTATKVYNYTYGNSWKDQLTSFDGTAITYDAAGNPTSYLGKTLTWSRGRLLTKYVSGSKTVDMQYDGKGIRVAKTMKIGTSVTTNSTYIYDNGGKLRTEIEGNTTRNYIYGQDGIVGYEENNEHFMYRKNFFGDITAIYKGATKVAEYKYDAWGNCTIILNTSGYGSRNPFRYRGYYFDSDLGMYYLMTRYYDPKIGRFINADSTEYLAPHTINGLNLYSYCNNNPIKYCDKNGNNPEVAQKAGVFVTLAALAALLDGPLPIGDLLLVLVFLLSFSLIGDNTIEKVEEEVDVDFSTNEPDSPIIFPIDPNLFMPEGLVKVVRTGTKNGTIITWMDPATNKYVFRWDENPNYENGPHYHINGIEYHFKPGIDCVPQDYAERYFPYN